MNSEQQAQIKIKSCKNGRYVVEGNPLQWRDFNNDSKQLRSGVFPLYYSKYFYFTSQSATCTCVNIFPYSQPQPQPQRNVILMKFFITSQAEEHEYGRRKRG